MPVSELPPPAGYRFNTGIGVLPQFRAGPPTIRDLPSGGPTVETPTSNYPAAMPPTMPPSTGGFGAGATPADYRDSATLGYPNTFGNSTGWRDNAIHQDAPHQSFFAKLGGFLGDLFNTDAPNSTPPSDTPPGMPQQAQGGGIPMKRWQEIFNTGRFSDAPFAPTVAQAMFPGSRIGPGGSSVANPYDPGAPRGPMSHDTGLSGTAAAFHNYVAQRNII